MSPPPPYGEQTGLHEAARGVRNGPVGGISLWWKFRHGRTSRNHDYCGPNDYCGPYNDGRRDYDCGPNDYSGLNNYKWTYSVGMAQRRWG